MRYNFYKNNKGGSDRRLFLRFFGGLAVLSTLFFLSGCWPEQKLAHEMAHVQGGNRDTHGGYVKRNNKKSGVSSDVSEKNVGSAVKSMSIFGNIDAYGNNITKKEESMDSGESMGEKELKSQKIEIMSDAFVQGGLIPSKYTCEGADISPPLTWHVAPVGTESIVLICDDPDAPMGSWTHWVVFNLPPETTYLPEKAMIKVLGGVEGVNSWGNNSYGGPCPPSGEHRYFFMLYMLSKKLDLDEMATKEQALAQVNAHGGKYILGEGQLVGRYKKHG